eukprot:950403_1
MSLNGKRQEGDIRDDNGDTDDKVTIPNSKKRKMENELEAVTTSTRTNSNSSTSANTSTSANISSSTATSVNTSDTKNTSANASRSVNVNTPACTSPTLYVSNLHHRISEPHLQKLFQRFGEIHRVVMIRRSGTGVNVNANTKAGRGRGGHHSNSKREKQGRYPKHEDSGYSYAFVEFKSIQVARTAMEKVNGVSLLGKQLVVKSAHGTSSSSSSSRQGAGVDGDELGKDGIGSTPSMKDVRKQKNDVENKIDALKRALKEKGGKF